MGSASRNATNESSCTLPLPFRLAPLPPPEERDAKLRTNRVAGAKEQHGAAAGRIIDVLRCEWSGMYEPKCRVKREACDVCDACAATALAPQLDAASAKRAALAAWDIAGRKKEEWRTRKKGMAEKKLLLRNRCATIELASTPNRRADRGCGSDSSTNATDCSAAIVQRAIRDVPQLSRSIPLFNSVFLASYLFHPCIASSCLERCRYGVLTALKTQLRLRC
jgi:hypothetical protein